MSSWHTLPGNGGRSSLDHFVSPRRETLDLSKRIQPVHPSKLLQEELEKCKEKLGEWEVRAVAAEAEVTSLGFQKVAMEHEMTKQKERIKQLNDQLTTEKMKNRKSNVDMLEKLNYCKDALSELRKSENEAKKSLENVRLSVQEFRDGAISKEFFLSQVECVFNSINNKPKNGKVLKAGRSFDEKVRSSFQLQSSLRSLISEQPIQEEDDQQEKEPSPPSAPPVPSRSLGVSDEPPTVEQNKPIPPPRRNISSPNTGTSIMERKQKTSFPLRRRLSSLVDSLYSLAPPPGSPVHTHAPPLGVLGAMKWSVIETDSDSESDFEEFTPPGTHGFSDSRSEAVPSSLFSSVSTSKVPSQTIAHSAPKKYKSTSSVESFTKSISLEKENSFSSTSASISHQDFASSLGHVLDSKEGKKEEEGTIKKSSPIMTKRPVWFKRDSTASVTSTKIVPEISRRRTSTKRGETVQKRRSRSLDAAVQRKVSLTVNQIRQQPVALSDSEDTTGGSSGYSKPFLHIQMRKKLLSHRQTKSAESLDRFFSYLDWDCYDDDSEEDAYYINPDEVARRYYPKSTTVEQQGPKDYTYMLLMEPQHDTAPQRRVGVSVHSPSPSPSPSFVPVPQRSCNSEGTSDTDSSGYEHVDSNIYENPDKSRHSPLFDNHLYGSKAPTNPKTDELYARIDDVSCSKEYISSKSSSFDSTTSNRPSIGAHFSPLPADEDWQNDDGYARVSEIQMIGSRADQAPSLPPRPPGFTRVVRSGNPQRTVPGIGSLPRYTTLGGSEHPVRLVPLDKTSSWRQTGSLDQAYTSLDGKPSPTRKLPKKSLQHQRYRGQPNLRIENSLGQIYEKSSSELQGVTYSSVPTTSMPPSAMSPNTLKRVSGVVRPRSSTFPTIDLHTVNSSVPGSVQSAPVEKSGYMSMIDDKQKAKKKWLVLRGSELKVFTKQTNKKHFCKINLDKCCKLSIDEGRTEIRLDLLDKEYVFSAANKTDWEEWLRVFEIAMQGVSRSASPEVPEEPSARTLSGWASVDGSKQMWCSLQGSILNLAPEKGAEPTLSLDMEKCTVKRRRDSILLDQSATSLNRNMVLHIRHRETKKVTLIQAAKENATEEWCYTLNSIQSGEQGPQLTKTEQFLSVIMKGDPSSHSDHPKWSTPIFKVAVVPIHEPLLSMPTTQLKAHAISLFQDLQKFMNKTLDIPSMEFHVSLAQKIIGQCLSNAPLQNEVYCQLLKQMSGHTTPTSSAVLQGWLLLFLLIPMYCPSRKIVTWYLNTFLERSISSKSSVICELAKNCQTRLQSATSRQCTPTYFELKALFEEYISSPLAPPTGLMRADVYLADGSVHGIGFLATCTVADIVAELSEQLGLEETSTTGFALMCDWPGVSEGTMCCPFQESKMCDVISMWTLSMEELNQHSQAANLELRNITFAYKRRLAFQKRQGSESTLECVLLAHQISKDILEGTHPVTSQQAIQLAAIMAQLEYGDWEQKGETIAREAVERFCPWKLTYMALEHDWQQLQFDLSENWRKLARKSRDECAQLYLSQARATWPMYGATLYKAEQQAGHSTSHQSLWLAIHEGGVSLLKQKSMELIKTYSYTEISTFGGYGEENFMLVVTPSQDSTPLKGKRVTTRGEKLLLSMDKIQICEATFLMATYIERLKKGTSADKE